MTDIIKPIIVAIAKKEQNYIEEWVRWHIAIGFNHIFLYDNEDTPTYEKQLLKYRKYITVIHLPGNNFHIGVQYIALDHFRNHFMYINGYTHCIHIDIDEFIVLHKHNNITNFIEQFIIDDCGAIGINWRFFGDSGNTNETNDPVVRRFIYRENLGNPHIKTLYKISAYNSNIWVHGINLNFPYYSKNTKGDKIDGCFNHNYDFNFIQINHYKSKTFQEFISVYNRKRADMSLYNQYQNSDIISIRNTFNHYNINEEQDLSAYNFFETVNNFWVDNSIKIQHENKLIDQNIKFFQLFDELIP
jgi:hypothetical protein